MLPLVTTWMYLETKEVKFIVVENRMVVPRVGEVGGRKVAKRYKLPVIRKISTRDIMYNTTNIINTAVCYI